MGGWISTVGDDGSIVFINLAAAKMATFAVDPMGRIQSASVFMAENWRLNFSSPDAARRVQEEMVKMAKGATS
jgi:hypothetical protein